MSFVIPQKKPGTPLNQFYSLGKYHGSLTRNNFLQPVGRSGVAATLNQRNHSNDSGFGTKLFKIKPQIHEPVDARHYKPLKYLRPVDEHRGFQDDLENKRINNS